MSDVVELFVPLDETTPLADLVARSQGRSLASIGLVTELRRALDARKGRPMGHRLRVEVRAPGEAPAGETDLRRPPPQWPAGRARPKVVIVGSGPAGTWAALRLIEAGMTVTILERGKRVQPRRLDLAQLLRGDLNPESNYCFGEGGAGTYSDGKLYTRTKDRVGVAQILADLVRYGAPADISVEARPHVGSNRLPKVLTSLREHLEENGVTYRFESEASGLVVSGGRLRAVRLRGGDELPADVVILATGHSARSVYHWLHDTGVALERKAFAVGVRLEHPQPVIDRLQYGSAAGHPRLPAAFYELKSEGAGRGVYSFCMCPGGWIVPATTEIDGVVVNGMSLSRRDSPFANSGWIVEVRTADFGPDAAGPLAGLTFQSKIEAAAFSEGGGRFRAPAVRLNDFLAGRPSTSLPKASYRPGIVSGDLSRVLPAPLYSAMQAGLLGLCRRTPGFVHGDAVLIAAETRTSSPVRILREPVTLMSPSIEGLYPVGEGAGYAGGIISAALDGVRAADAIVLRAAAPRDGAKQG